MNYFPYKLVDLTHTLESTIPTWDSSCGFEQCLHKDYSHSKTYKFKSHNLKMQAGIGTHIDAPAHCDPLGFTIDQLPLENLILPCVLIDVSATADENYRVSVSDILKFEKKYNKIPKGHFIMIRTGWEQFWNEPHKYWNNLRFPSVSENAAKLLLEREIAGLGVDTLSPDRPEDGFPVHKLLLEAGKTIIENVANLKLLPVQGSIIEALPIKTKGGTEAPIRLIGLI